jgi:hypothetical protein
VLIYDAGYNARMYGQATECSQQSWKMGTMPVTGGFQRQSVHTGVNSTWGAVQDDDPKVLVAYQIATISAIDYLTH